MDAWTKLSYLFSKVLYTECNDKNTTITDQDISDFKARMIASCEIK